MESTVFHEATHWGDTRNGKMDHIQYLPNGEIDNWNGAGGKQFEIKAYGNDINWQNYQYYSKKLNRVNNVDISMPRDNFTNRKF